MKKAVDWHAPKRHPRPCRADGLKPLSTYIEAEYKDKFDMIRRKKRFTSKELLETMIKRLK